MVANPIHITLATMLGAFVLSGLSIVLGYLLIVGGSTGEFKFTFSAGPIHVNLYALVPGLAFAAFGMIIAVLTVRAVMGVSHQR